MSENTKVILSASTIHESLKIKFTKQLKEFRENPSEQKLEFDSSLSNVERKFIHGICEELGLVSKSTGKGENRFVSITKRVDLAKKITPKVASNDIPVFNLSVEDQTLLTSCLSSLSRTEFINQNSLNIPSFRKPSSFLQDRHFFAANYEKFKSLHTPKSADIFRDRGKLPVSSCRDLVLSAMKDNQIILVSGETGCGKSTQIPQFFLEDPIVGKNCRIAVSQPRRLSAISVAERIAYERCETLGDVIGYNIRMEKAVKPNSQVIFMTPGVLVRKIQSDPLLEEYSHIIIDEAHERDRFSEFLLIVIRDICARRKDLKVILMSATLHTDSLSTYFGIIPHVHVGGSIFPVKEYHLEDILRFTNYYSSVDNVIEPISNSQGITSFEDALELRNDISQKWECPLCSSRAFPSAEEFGIHIVTCDGSLSSSSSSILPKEIKKSKSARDVVRELSHIFQRSALSNVSDSQLTLNDNNNNNNNENDLSQEATEFQVSTDEATTIQEEREADYDMHSESDEDNDDSSSTGSLMEITNNSASESVSNSTSSADDALLSHYQFSFDDNQVDVDLIAKLMDFVVSSEFGSSGNILVFLPGWEDITELYGVLMASSFYSSNPSRYTILQLHSGVSREDQKKVFVRCHPPHQKIILSTNIAETSITIDDVSVVIDSGRMKEITYDPFTKLSFLQSSWVSKSSAIQRKGRAGRTRPGTCFHLFSKRRYLEMPLQQQSELLRMSLEEVILQTKALGLAEGKESESNSASAFLLRAMDPPHPLALLNGINVLKGMKCLDAEEKLTPFGNLLAQLPVHPRMGRFILLGCLFNCDDYVTCMAASMEYRDPFVLPRNDWEKKSFNAIQREYSSGYPCDQLCIFNCVQDYKMRSSKYSYDEVARYCHRKYLSPNTLRFIVDIDSQLKNILKENRWYSKHTEYWKDPVSREKGQLLLMSLVGFALYPDVGFRYQDSKHFRSQSGRKMQLHKSSLGKSTYDKPAINLNIIGFQRLFSLPTSSMSFMGISMSMGSVCPLSLWGVLLACSELKVVDPSTLQNVSPVGINQCFVQIDDLVTIVMDRTTLELVHHCREALYRALCSVGSTHKVPGMNRFLSCLKTLLVEEQRHCFPRK